jgi:hypothetical protein
MNPTNQFVAYVTIPFPDDVQGLGIDEWYHHQNNGKVNKRQLKHLHSPHEYRFVFEVTKNGDWIYVGRKE